MRADRTAEWVRGARDGDRAAFAELYRGHVGRIHALCTRLCGGDRHLAESLTQDAFLRAWQKLPSYRGEAAFGTWLHRLAVNVVLGSHRAEGRRARREELAPAPNPRAPQSGDQALDLEAAIASLPERARGVLVLHELEGYQHAEIAELMGISVGTSKAQLHRARALLKDRLR